MNSTTDKLPVHDAAETAAALDYPALVAAIATAATEMEAGAITSPERQVLPLGQGGVMLSMPATAADIGIHKLVNVQPANARRGLPTIHGTVTVFDTATGRPLGVLDGPTVTGRRTAAVSLLALQRLLPAPPKAVLLFGTGTQAVHHVQALHAIYPDTTLWVKSRSLEAAQAFCDQQRALHKDMRPCGDGLPQDFDAVITLTTSTEPVYDEAARPGRLVVGVGAFKPEMAEIGQATLDGSDLYADDPAGARHEAGDLLRAGVDWSRVASLAHAVREPADFNRPIVFKSVGCAAWDLAAARVAISNLGLNPQS